MGNRGLVFLYCFIAQYHITLAQTSVQGSVFDTDSRQPLQGAYIFSPLDSTVTDEQGHFSILVGLDGKVQVSFLGYQRETVNFFDSDNRKIFLKPASLALNEIMVLGGLRQMPTRNVIGSVSPITREMVIRDDPFQISSALNRVPGLYMHSGTFSTSRITIRGIGSRDLFGTSKIKAYIGQIPLTDGGGNATLEDIDQSFIERLEVIKGPNSSIYGAGLGGTILVQAKKPDKAGTQLASGLTAGSFNTLQWYTNVGHQDDKMDLVLSYSELHSDGYRDNSEYDREQIGLHGQFYLTDKTTLSVLGLFTDLTAFIPSAINKDDYDSNPEKAAFTWGQARGFESYRKSLMGVSLSSELSDRFYLQTSIFSKFRNAYEPRPFNILSENTVSLGTRNVLSYRTGELTWSLGTEIFSDVYAWETFENLYDENSNGSVLGAPLAINEETRNYWNAFTEVSVTPTESLRLVAGVNLNSTNYDLDDRQRADGDQSGDYSFDPVLSPRLGGNWTLTPAQNLFFNISHGFSPPGLDETLYPDGQINPNIQPEKGWNFELGLRGRKGMLSYDLTVYHMIISDLLVAQRTAADAFVGVNAGRNDHTGLELFLNFASMLSENYTLNLFNSLSLMHYRFTDFENEGVRYDGNQLTGVPSITLSPGIEVLSESGFYGNVNGQYVGRIPMDDGNSIYADDYFLLRLKGGYRISAGPWSFDLYAGITNLTAEKYASMLLINATGFGGAAPRYYYPGTPRSYFSGLHAAFTF